MATTVAMTSMAVSPRSRTCHFAQLDVATLQMSTNSTLNGNVEMSTANGFNSGIITNPLQVPGVGKLGRSA